MPGWHSTSRHDRGYGYAWVKLRERILRRDSYLCQPCLKRGRPKPATEVDHIIGKAQDGTDDPENLQAICHACHVEKTKRENSGYRRRKTITGVDGWPIEDGLTRWGYSIPDGVEPSAIPVILVSGPPAAGKSTYIAQNAEAGDIVIDFDIYRQRVGGKKWDTDNKVWREAFKLRDADIRSLAHRSSGKCFLIVTAPTKDERDKWCEALGDVRVHVIATPEDECIARIKADPNRHEASSSQIEAVKHWWRYN